MAENVTELRKETTNGDAKLPDRETLMNLHRNITDQAAKMDEIRGELGATLKDAADTKNVHKAAFRLSSKLLRMTEEKRDDFLTAFDYYRETMGVDEGRTGDMFAGNGEPAAAAQ